MHVNVNLRVRMICSYTFPCSAASALVELPSALRSLIPFSESILINNRIPVNLQRFLAPRGALGEAMLDLCVSVCALYAFRLKERA